MSSQHPQEKKVKYKWKFCRLNSFVPYKLPQTTYIPSKPHLLDLKIFQTKCDPVTATNYAPIPPKITATAVLEKKMVIVEPHCVLKEKKGCEHPSINRKFTGRKYKFSYVIGWLESVNKGSFATKVTKVNMETGESLVQV